MHDHYSHIYIDDDAIATTVSGKKKKTLQYVVH